MSGARVVIHYRRPPDRAESFEQWIVHRTPACAVTLLDAATVSRPMLIDGVPVLEPGAPIVWFTFRDAWHDVGRFHTRDGRFTGFYANVLTPVRGFDSDAWETTDLFLDVWLPPGGAARLLDEDELAAARAAAAIDAATASRAAEEAAALLRAARAGAWPPSIVHDWTVERARRHVPRTGGVR